MKKKSINIFFMTTLILFFIHTALLFVNVRTMGTSNTEIGLSFINKLVSNVRYNEVLDKISDILLIICILLIAFFAIVGGTQLIKRKNILKVDKEILSFGILVIIMFLLWMLFDNVIVLNHRPILIDGNLEPSYPSTHIMIVTFVMLSAVSLLGRYYTNKKINYILISIAISSIVLTVVLRIASGMHWITDCSGGLLLGLTLYYIFRISQTLGKRTALN